MGRSYIVEEEVEKYLSSLCSSSSSPLTGLLIGQSSAQRDLVVMATQTPQREESSPTPPRSQNTLDMQWITEHARQVFRMLPGGLSVLGIFYISDNEAKDTLSSLRQLVFAVQKSVSRDVLWVGGGDDITERVTLHIRSTTRKTFCRTFDVSDPKSAAKPADWRYQAGVCGSWAMVWSCVEVEIPVLLPHHTPGPEDLETGLEEGLRLWSQQIQTGTFLLDGFQNPPDTELTAGHTKRNAKQTFRAQILTKPVFAGGQSPQVVRGGGRVVLKGAVHARAYLHGNKPTARLAEKVLKSDLVSTVAVRVQMVLEELMAAQDTPDIDRLSLPRRVLHPLLGGCVCVCDYQFGDEGLGEVVDRFKEILDLDVRQEDLDTTQETSDTTDTHQPHTEMVLVKEKAPQDVQKKSFLGVAMGTSVVLLAVAAAALLYLED